MAGAGHSQWGIPDTESLQIATIKARLPGDIGTLGQRHHGHIGDNVGAGAWGGGIEGGTMVRALREGEELRGVPGPLTSTYHPRCSPTHHAHMDLQK